jgi:hypothetical protein
MGGISCPSRTGAALRDRHYTSLPAAPAVDHGCLASVSMNKMRQGCVLRLIQA